MTVEQHKQVEELFDALVDLSLMSRVDELARLCPQDTQVRAEVQRLLASADKNTSLGEPPLLKFLSDQPFVNSRLSGEHLIGSAIDNYHILAKLGDGGFGSVYKAEQRYPVRRTVALKLIKLGFDTREVIARFDSERQALARMDHPNIAKVLDAGSTEEGRPYFVLDYVAGLSITKFADQNRLTIRERLLLFIQVCEAIAHAHQKAIIHRDIKAGNVMAFMQDGKPRAKVIDFGIAKALTSDRLTDLTFNTASGMAIGTYGSMSPEQASGSPDIDTRTDVYSLGVLLYELLTGVPPFDPRVLAEADHDEARRIIREVDPLKPSATLMNSADAAQRIAELRRTDAVSLIRQLRHELEWIPMKAMRKERDRRYRSPQQLADDVQNYLHGRPLLAGPESRIYRFKKSLKQNARLVGAICTIIAVLILGIVATTIETSNALNAKAKVLKLAEDNGNLALDKSRLADQMFNLANERSAALGKANEQLGLALLERARLLKDMHQYFAAAMTAASAIGFEGDLSGPSLPQSTPLLARGTQAWRDALDISLIPASGRLIWRSPAMIQHDGPVRCVGFSPDGRLLASGSDDQTVRLWDLATGEPLQTLAAFSPVESVSFSPDGKTVASGSFDKTVRLWDVATGKLQSILWGHSQAVCCVSFSPDGKLLASGAADSTIYLWDLATRQAVKILGPGHGPISSIAFSPDGAALASASSDGTVCLWDMKHFILLKSLHGHTKQVETLTFSADGRQLATGGDDQMIRIWDLSTGQVVQTFASFSPVTSISFSPDGKTIASGSLDKVIHLWDLSTGKLRMALAGHSEAVNAVRFSPDGKLLASGSADNTIRFWDPATGEAIGRNRTQSSLLQPHRGHQDNVTSISFSPDGKVLASASRDQTIRLWNAGTGELLSTLVTATDSGNRGALSVCFSADSATIAAESSNGPTVTVWNASTGQLVRTLTRGTGSSKFTCVALSSAKKILACGWIDNTILLWDLASDKPLRTLRGHLDEVTSLSFSPDGNTLASGSNDSTIRIWDVSSGESTQVLRGHNRAVLCLNFSPDGKMLASGSRDLSIILWDTASFRPLRALQAQARVINSVSFSPDGATLASASDDSTVQLWDVRTGEPLQVLRGTPDCVSSISFSPNGKTMASGSRDSTVSMWDVSSDQPVRMMDGHENSISEITFDADGKTLASSSFDHTVRLWDLASGRTLKVFQGGSGVPEPQYSVSFGGDGRMLASGSDDKTVRIWDTVSGNPLAVLNESKGIIPVRFSPDGTILAYGVRDGTVHLWDVRKRQPLMKWRGHMADIFSLAFSPTGQILATGSKDDTVRLWDVKSGAPLMTLRGQKGTVFSVCFSPDGTTLASGSADGTICLWQTDTGRRIQSFTSTLNSVTSVTFSPDGKILASGADDGIVRLWDIAGARQYRSLLDSRRGVWALRFSPDGKILASGNDEHKIKLWRVLPPPPLRQYLAAYHFTNLDLIATPSTNLYGDSGFYAQASADSN